LPSSAPRSVIAGNEQNLIGNICRSTLVKLKQFENFRKNGKLPSWKIVSMKVDIDYWISFFFFICSSTLTKPNTIFEILKRRQNPWKTTSIKYLEISIVDLIAIVCLKSGIKWLILAQPQLTYKFESELGTAQPQLVLQFSYFPKRCIFGGLSSFPTSSLL
jgi:hypothetical protein